MIVVAPATDRAIDAAAVRSLYDDADWWPTRSVARIEALIADGAGAVGAWDGDELVGFGRVISDGRFRAYIEDVVVRSDHRRHGTALALLKALLALVDGVDVVSLFCQPDLVPLYEQAGFRATHQVVMHRAAP